MKKLILKVGAMLLVIGAMPLASGVAQGGIGGEWREGAITDYFLEPDCAWIECNTADPGITDCCTYWIGY